MSLLDKPIVNFQCLIQLVGTRDVRTQSTRAQLGPFSSYREKGERRPSSGTRADVGDSLRKHTSLVPVHLWQRAWFMAWDPGLRGETGLRHRPGSTHLGAARPAPSFFLLFGSLTIGTPVSNLKPACWDLGPGLVGTQDSGLGK
jgi:hypothetical protein